jgi:hypothetical protein
MPEEPTATPFLDSLTDRRVFRVFIPAITKDQLKENQPYVIRIVIPKGAQFLEVMQIEPVSAGLGAFSGSSTTAYAFLCDHDVKETETFYTTSWFSDRPMPWASGQSAKYVDATPFPKICCSPLNTTSHSGIPLLHLRVCVVPTDYKAFEAELVTVGYVIINTKPYDSESLLAYYQARAKSAPSSPTSPPAVG